MMNVGFLGTGTIAAAMVRGIADAQHAIWVSERNQTISAELSATFPNVTRADNQTVLDNSDVVIVCLMADTAREILPQLNFRAGQRVFSVMVDIDLAAFDQLVQPANGAAIFIPFPFIAIGNSPLLVYPASDTLQTLFGGRNQLIVLSEEAGLLSYLAAQAVLLPTLKLLHEALGWLQGRVGEEIAAEKFLRLLVGGYLTAAPLDRPNVLANALVDLGTTGGLNAQLRDHFGTHGVYDALTSGLDALEQRLH